MPASNVYIGLDAGGSNTELLARFSSAPLPPARRAFETEEVHLWGPGANPKRVGRKEAADTLATLVRRVMKKRPEARLRAVCAGVAGADSDTRRQALTACLQRALGEQETGFRLQLVHDARIALEAAFGRESGIIVIAGTGSAVFARTKGGALERAGGWGYILGDEGSGYALGRAGLRAAARALDGGSPTLIRTFLPEKYGAKESRRALIRSVYDAAQPLQDAARAVLKAAKADDGVAIRILDEQTSALAQQVAWLAERGAAIAPQVALFGGLVNDEHYVETLREAVAEHLDWPVWPASTTPVRGALQLALRQEDARRPTDLLCA